jgi:hypothetical protein
MRALTSGGCGSEADRLESIPENVLGYRNQRDIRQVIRPDQLTGPPLAAATFLHPNEGEILEVAGGGQDLAFGEDDPDLADRLGLAGPGLEMIVLLAGDFEGNHGGLPQTGLAPVIGGT